MPPSQVILTFNEFLLFALYSKAGTTNFYCSSRFRNISPSIKKANKLYLSRALRFGMPVGMLPDQGGDSRGPAPLVKGAGAVLDGVIIPGQALDLAQIVQP